MRKPILPHDAFVFVGDGRKALVLRNAGDEKFANFVVEQAIEDENPATHDQGSDRPGRNFAAAHSVRRSAVESTDWHVLEEHRFAERASKALAAYARPQGARAGDRRAAANAGRPANGARPRREGESSARDQQGPHPHAGLGDREACRGRARARLIFAGRNAQGPRRIDLGQAAAVTVA